jgi:WhiB family redox-sensing transcriptional regulator
MQQPSSSTGGSWRNAHEFFSIVITAEVEETPRYRSVTSLMPEWHMLAACCRTDKSVFFGSSSPEERPAYTLSSIRKARAICASCPVFNECLAHAIKQREDYGLWAGTTMRQRKELFRKIDSREITEQDVIDNLKRKNHDRRDHPVP